MTYIFLDTNIFLHFKPFDEIDWQKLTGDENITLVVPWTVSSELDKKKYDPKSNIQSRAKRSIKRILDYRTGKLTSKKFEFQTFTKRPLKIVYEQSSLDSDSPDDQIIAAVLSYKNDEKDSIHLATDDAGQILTALDREIKVLELPTEFKLVEKSELQMDNEKLKAKLLKYEQRSPKLNLLFEEGAQVLEVTLERFHFLDWKREQLAIEKKRNPEVWIEGPSKLFEVVGRKADFEKYNQDLRNYHEKLEEYLDTNSDHFIQQNLTFPLKMILVNNGTSKATDIEVSFKFPDFTEVYTLKDLPKDPEKPSSPRHPNAPIIPSGYSLQSFPQINSDFINNAISHDPFSIIDEEGDLKFYAESLKHGKAEIMDDIVVSFKNLESIKSFSFEYEIYSDEDPETTKGKLNVKIDLID